MEENRKGEDDLAGVKRKLKNRKRKLKKKRREKQLKEEGKGKKQRWDRVGPSKKEWIEEEKEEQFDKSLIESIEKTTEEKKIEKEEEEKEELDRREGSVKVSSEKSKSVQEEEILERFRKTSFLSKEAELKEFFQYILSTMKNQLSVSTDLQVIKKLKETEAATSILSKMLDEKSLSKNIVSNLWTIKRKLVTQQYSDAEQVYFTLTIGTAGWPTIESPRGILNDAEKLSLLQAIKRLMTFWQQEIAPAFIPADEKSYLKTIITSTNK